MKAAEEAASCGVAAMAAAKPAKLHGRAFYESIGSPRHILAPMVDQSEFAWRMLTRSFLPAAERGQLLAYTPMMHARLFSQEEKYRRAQFLAVRPGTAEAWLDGNPAFDRPLIVQFCANDPDMLLAAAQRVAPYCDAVDLNLGCPQGIARKGRYGSFLQEDQDLIYRLINKLHKELPIPVTAKIRILETREKTLAYAKNVLSAGASILTVHGRRREQKGHLTGLADWDMIRYLREQLPPESVLFANGNILQPGDVEECLKATGADGVMSAEGNLSDPAIFSQPRLAGQHEREYWHGKDGLGGWRVDAVMRRYLDIIHKYALGCEPPPRRPLFLPGDDTSWLSAAESSPSETDESAPRKRRKTDAPPAREAPNPNLSALQPHLFHLLRHLLTRHTDVRDMLARSRRQGIDGFERVLAAVEAKVAEGLLTGELPELPPQATHQQEEEVEGESSRATVRRCWRPWWVAQPIVRPLPAEALAKGAVRLKKREREGEEVEMAERDVLVAG